MTSSRGRGARPNRLWSTVHEIAHVDAALDRYYPRRPDGIRRGDGTEPLYAELRRRISPTSVVLNIGAGRTTDPRRQLKPYVGRLVGVDIDPTVGGNADLHEAYVIDGRRLPFESAKFDVAYADWTLEHVDKPATLLAEIRRVLRDGGCFLARTPNLWHYAVAFSAATPYPVHQLVANRVRRLAPDAHRPWPTYYRANTIRKLRRLASASGFKSVAINPVEPPPAYLAFSVPTLMLGVTYERIINASSAFAKFRHTLIVTMET